MAPPMMCKPNSGHKKDSSVLWNSARGIGNKEGSCLHPIISLLVAFSLSTFSVGD